MRTKLTAACGVVLALATAAHSADKVGPWDPAALASAPQTYEAPGFSEPGVRALFYEGLPYKGKPTRVFAWYGAPAVKQGEKVPGIVLVHGGGGTAFAEWVRLWNQRGYAAIAMDTCGATAGGTHMKRPRHGFGGPPGWGGFDQIDEPVEDQWTYHAVADTVLANSLLRSFPEVDPNRVGVTGISWGGVVTAIAAGVDDRFRFAAPVYGSGYLGDESAFQGAIQGRGADKAARWVSLWDPSSYLSRAKMPLLWVSGTNDFAFPLNSLQRSYRLPSGTRTLSIRLRMAHGQEQGAAPDEILAFADSVVRGGQPLPQVTEQGRDGANVWATFKARTPLQSAALLYTRDAGAWKERRWESVSATVDGAQGRITATLPEGATVYYFNLIDGAGRIVSTEHNETRAGGQP